MSEQNVTLSIFSLGDYDSTMEGYHDAIRDGATNEIDIPSDHLATATKSIFETADKLGGDVAIALISNDVAISIIMRLESPDEKWKAKAELMRKESFHRIAENTHNINQTQ
jgi:hypothetical protein